MQKHSATPLKGYENYFMIYPPSECCLDGDDLGCEEAMFGFRVYVFVSSEDAACRAGRCGW
jgi:hypothetical protein